ncbi:MAG: hypothetical protein EA359_07025 [Balneolaceae bacterium]|nr:MAG: hypothetical protein EA359_07025 [Balneolaceae bacterium]
MKTYEAVITVFPEQILISLHQESFFHKTEAAICALPLTVPAVTFLDFAEYPIHQLPDDFLLYVRSNFWALAYDFKIKIYIFKLRMRNPAIVEDDQPSVLIATRVKR